MKTEITTNNSFILALCLILLLSACYGNIPAEHFNKATDLCSKNDGLKVLTVDSLRVEGREIVEAVCNDGAVYPQKMIIDK